MKESNKTHTTKSEQYHYSAEMVDFIDDLPVQLWFMQDADTYGIVNNKHADFLGMSKAELEFKKLHEFMPTEEIVQHCSQSNSEVIASKKSMKFKEWTVDARGEQRLLEIAKTPHFHDDGSLSHIVCTATDITEIYQTDKSRRISEDKFQAIVENVQDTVFQLNMQGEFIYISPAVFKHSGLKPEQVIGKKFHDFVLPDDVAHVDEIFKQGDNGDVKEFEFRTMDAKRQIDHVRVISSISENYDGAKVITGVISKITERKELEQELAESKKLLQMILDHVPQAIFWKDDNLKFQGANQAFLQQTSLDSAEELIGKTDFDMHWASQADAFRTDDRKVMHAGKAILNYTEKLETHDQEKWLRTSKIPIKDSEENIIGILGMFEDITEEKEAVERLEEQEKNWRTLFNSINDSVFIHAPQGEILEVNDAACEMMGYNKSELLNLSVNSLDSLDYQENVDPAIGTMKQEGSARMETVTTAKDNSQIPLEISARMFEYFGKPAILSVARDISDRRKAEKHKQQLLNSYEKIIEQSDIGVALIDAEFNLTYANKITANLVGWDLEKIQGASVRDIVGKDGLQTIQKNMQNRENGKGSSYYLPHTRPDGTRITLHLSGNPIHGAEGELQGSLGIIREVA
ncbi:MAG: PAS domain S-box protein, partial [Candidatus Marinimicrobia bacterium]|nr:PAS domain S-box protein [Candidatus Neomarinimicrobiota bacterium]